MNADPEPVDSIAVIYDAADDKTDTRAMAETALRAATKFEIREHAIKKWMDEFGDHIASLKPRPSIRKLKASRSGKRSINQKTKMTLAELLITPRGVGGDKLKLFGDFTIADHEKAARFFHAQRETASANALQHEELAEAQRTYGAQYTRELPDDVLEQLIMQ